MKFRTLIRHQPGTVLEFATGAIAIQPSPPFDTKGAGFAEFETRDEAIIDRLMDIPEGFAVVEGVPPAAGAVEQLMPLASQGVPGTEVESVPEQPSGPAAPAFILTDKDTGSTLDLSTLDDAALKAFVKDNGIKGVHHKLTGDKLRAAIVAATAG